MVKLAVGGGIVGEAYHMKDFTTKIIFVGQITVRNNVLFTCDDPDEDKIITCAMTQRLERVLSY